MRKTLLLLFLFIGGCANSDFPFCCNPEGVASVPYVTTYHFDIGTGFSNIGGTTSFLTIFSRGDEIDLFNAANISEIPGMGAVAGTVLSLAGGPASGVVLQATDAAGNPVGDLFYNSLGGIPDFSTTSGTNVSGGFTLLNGPPGDIYFKAVQGGRGNGSVMVFGDSVSVANIGVVPVTQPVIGVTGVVRDFETGSPVTFGAGVSPLGLKGLNINSNGGTYSFVQLGSDSDFIFQVSPPASQVPPLFLTTYNRVNTDLASLSSQFAGAVDVTDDVNVFTTDFFTRLKTLTASTTGLTVDPALSILAGVNQDPDGTHRLFSYLDITDDSGNLLNFEPGGAPRVFYRGTYPDPSTGVSVPTWFFFKDPRVYWALSTGQATTIQIYWSLSTGQIASTGCHNDGKTCPPSDLGMATDGTFVAFNLPEGQVYLASMALEETPIGGGPNSYAGTEQTTIFSGGVTNENVTLNPLPLGQIGFYSPFFGQVTLPDKVTPVSFAQVYALGTAASFATSNPAGQFSYSAAQALFLNQGQYTIRTSASPGYVPTYQSNVSVDGSFHSLTLFPSSQVNGYISAAGLSGSFDPAKGILTGSIIDNGSLRATAGITLAATDLAGNPVGDIRYFDTHGLPILNSGSSKNGGYMIFNLPPGLIQVRAVSPDDSGNGLAEVYSGGIALADIHVNNSPPLTVLVSGATQDLNGAQVGAANLSILGEKTVFSSSNGLFSQLLSPYSTFFVKTTVAGGTFSTYNLFGTTGVDSPQTVFVATSASTLSAIAAGDATLSLPDLVNNGVIGGKVVTYGFTPASPVQGFSSMPLPSAGSWSQQRMVAGLFDGDNELDLAIVNELDNTLTILLGNGDGTFHPAVGSPLCLPLGTPMLPGQTCSTGAGPVAVRETDLNGDGVIDLIVVNKGLDSVTVLRGTGAGNFTLAALPLQLQSGSRPVGVSIEDFNNDQLTDLAVINSGSNSFTLIPGSGIFQFDMSHAKYFSTLGTNPVAVVSRDFNSDGNKDIAILNQGSGSVSVFLGLGNGYFSPAAGSPYTSPVIGSQPVSMAASDINGDGYFDLAVANSGSASVSILLGKPGGIFAPASGSPVSLSSSPQFILLTDVNLDNRLDLVTANADGTISVLTGLGDGTFFTPGTVYNAGGLGVNLASLELFDFTDDLVTDMVAFQGGTGNLLFFTGATVPLSGVTLASTNMAGVTEGSVRIRYLDQNSNIINGVSATDTSGRFLIFDVPPGPHDIFAKTGAAGNQWIKSYAGSATFGNIQMVPPQRKSILYSGLTGNLAGDQVVRNVPGVTVSVFGTGTTFLSSLLDSTFSFKADANHQLFIQLQR